MEPARPDRIPDPSDFPVPDDGVPAETLQKRWAYEFGSSLQDIKQAIWEAKNEADYEVKEHLKVDLDDPINDLIEIDMRDWAKGAIGMLDEFLDEMKGE